MRKTYIFILVAFLVFLLVCAYTEDTTITLKEITTVKSLGVNGHGKIKPELSYDKLDDLFDVSNEDLMLVFETIKYEYENTNTYSNGDVVTISCTYSERLAEQYGFKLDTEFDYTVKGLK